MKLNGLRIAIRNMDVYQAELGGFLGIVLGLLSFPGGPRVSHIEQVIKTLKEFYH